jgi:hypothetical protein
MSVTGAFWWGYVFIILMQSLLPLKWELNWVLIQDGNFPRGGGSPRRPDLNRAGTRAKFPPAGEAGWGLKY